MVDEFYSTSPSDDLYRERVLLQAEFDSVTNDKAVDMYLRSCLMHYECGDRASRMLSHQLKQSATAGFITAIKDEAGNILTTPNNINSQLLICILLKPVRQP